MVIPRGALLGGSCGCSRQHYLRAKPAWGGMQRGILPSRMGLSKSGVASSITPPSPTRGPSIVITLHPAPGATMPQKAHGGTRHWHDPRWGTQKEKEGGHPGGGGCIPWKEKRSPTALPEQVLCQGQHEGQALGRGTALAPGKSPALVPWPAPGRGDGAAAATPGAGRVTDGSPGWPGPAGFKVTREAKDVGLRPSLPGWETPRAPLHRLLTPPQTCGPPQEGDRPRGSPLSDSSSLAERGRCSLHPPPRTPAPQRGHGYQLEGHLCCRRRSWWVRFLASDGCGDRRERRLGLWRGVCQHTPSSQRNTQWDALGTPASPRVPAAPPQG